MTASDDDPLKVFINYRKADGAGWARLLYDRLAQRFGGENVFLDQVTLQPGTKWLRDTRSHSAASAAFIALIGPEWASILTERAGGPDEDHVRAEIEAALHKESRVREIIPALVDDARMPREQDLRAFRSLRPLLHRQTVDLRPSRWDSDVQELIERLERIADEPQGKPAAEEKLTRLRPSPDSTPAPPAPVPKQGQDQLVRLMLDEGSLVVPFLGPGTNSSDRSEAWHDIDSGYLPDGDELAAYLAQKVGRTGERADLAEVSQRLSVTSGPGDLFMALKKALPSRYPPSSVHRFLAGFPATLHRLGHREQYQLIVTTNYDDSLERAFDEAEEPYDIAVYMASGPDRGMFVHIPHDGEPKAVGDANRYGGFPIDEFGGVKRTVIMKIHGAVDAARGPYAWRNNYVITEDDYIDYLSDGDMESIVPQQLLGKLRDYSHFLFLGYTMRDWNLRVFLKRVLGERQQPPNTSWAIQRDPDRLEIRFWERIGVELSATPLDTFVNELESRVVSAAAVSEA